MSNTVYLLGIQAFGEAEIDYLSDTIKIALVESGYVPNFVLDQFFSDLTNEIVGGGYTAGGETLAGKTISIDAVGLRTVFDADDITAWDGDSFTGAAAAVIYKDTGVAGTSPLIAFLDIIPDQDAPLNLNFDDDGAFSIGAC